MFHVVIILIATCFGCTLYHFYAFSGTNLLTRCHSASSLFSAIFRFRNPNKEIFSESDEINYAINKRSGRSRTPEGTWRGPPRVPRHTRARPRWDPRRAMAWGPHLAPDASSSPIYRPRRVNPWTNRHNRKYTSVLHRHPKPPCSAGVSGVRSSCSGTLPEGRSSLEASTPPCLPPE